MGKRINRKDHANGYFYLEILEKSLRREMRRGEITEKEMNIQLKINTDKFKQKDKIINF